MSINSLKQTPVAAVKVTVGMGRRCLAQSRYVEYALLD